MRQPQASSAAVDMLAAKAAPTAEPSRVPIAPPVAANAPIKPRRPSGACSTRNTIELVYSPPTESLHHAQERQRDRRQQAECRVSRQKPDQEGRDRHGGDREGKCRAPPEAVADVADHHAA